MRGKRGRENEARGGGRERCLRARSTFLCWLRRRNIYYPVHGPEGEGWNRRGRGAGKSSRAANCPPSYPPYTLSHTLTVTTLIPLPPWSPPPAGSSLILHAVHPLFLPPQLPSSCSLSLDVPRRAAASKALDYLPLISARVAHLLPRLSRLLRDRNYHLLASFFFPFFLFPTYG